MSTTVSRLFHFHAGDVGRWRVERMSVVSGEGLPMASRLDVSPVAAVSRVEHGPAWSLRGTVSNERYVTRTEKTELVRTQEGLGRSGATRAALIPIRKTAAWWALPQDERRDILENRSHHIQFGMKFLPAVARRLHHCRDLGADEPFDFLTWFEYAPADAGAFDDLVQGLRDTPEWAYIEREVDIRLVRDEELP